jgi:hypothetical protein
MILFAFVAGGFALDAANKTLHLAPALQVDSSGAGFVSLPMFFPSFWATVEARTDGSGSGTVSVKVHFPA